MRFKIGKKERPGKTKTGHVSPWLVDVPVELMR